MYNKEELCRLEQSELVKLIEEGRLVYLPCKEGDTVYDIAYYCDYKGCSKTTQMGCCGCSKIINKKYIVASHSFTLFDLDKIGKTVFLVPEQAEQKLKEMNGNEKE